MIQSILLENFLAHKRTEITLGPGMTVLTGANNCGKSAVVEALRCVSQNPAPRHFIRHGAKEARVTVVVDDGTKITWIRKKATVIYEVLRPGAEEAETYRKLRKGQVPDEVLDLLRLDPVELKSGRPKMVDVHIGNQRTPIFLLGDDSADARMAEFFASSTEGAHLLSMQKLLKRRIRDNKTGATAAKLRMERLEADLDRIAPLPDIARQLEHASEMEQAVNASDQELPKLEQLLESQQRLVRHLEYRTGQVQALSGLVKPPQVEDTGDLERVCNGLSMLRGRIDDGRKRAQALGTLTDPPEVASTTPIVDTVQSLNSLTSQIKIRSDRSSILLELQEPPQLHEEQPLAGLLRDIENTEHRRKRLGKVLAEREAALMRLEADIAQRTKEVGNCPLCNGVLRPEAFLGGSE